MGIIEFAIHKHVDLRYQRRTVWRHWNHCNIMDSPLSPKLKSCEFSFSLWEQSWFNYPLWFSTRYHYHMQGPSLVLFYFIVFPPLCLIPLSVPIPPNLTGICCNLFDMCPSISYPIAFLWGWHSKMVFDSNCAGSLLLSSHNDLGGVRD